jgi:hypothetical protein
MFGMAASCTRMLAVAIRVVIREARVARKFSDSKTHTCRHTPLLQISSICYYHMIWSIVDGIGISKLGVICDTYVSGPEKNGALERVNLTKSCFVFSLLLDNGGSTEAAMSEAADRLFLEVLSSFAAAISSDAGSKMHKGEYEN